MEKVLLIADSGTTKTAWSVVWNGSLFRSVYTKGINPFFQTREEIIEEIEDCLMPQLNVTVDEVYFYGAGCVFEKADIVRDAIFSCIKVSEINVFSDLLGAARSTCGREAGIACIIGTGSNSCFYDGREIVENVPPLGFVLGDEGGGAMLGRLLVSDILKEILPEHLRGLFFERFKLTQADILDHVYKRPFPNRFLAILSPFLSEHIDVPEIYAIVFESFISFFTRNIMQYDYDKYPAHFVGSVAYHYKEILIAAAKTVKVRTGRILKSPMSGLLDFHNVL